MNEVSDSCSNWFLDFLEINSSNNDKGLDFSATFYVRLGLSSEVVYIVYHPSYEYDYLSSINVREYWLLNDSCISYENT